VRVSGELPGDLKLEREGFLSSFSDDIKTGDRLFDAAVRVRGAADLALTIFGEGTRMTIQGAIGSGGVVRLSRAGTSSR